MYYIHFISNKRKFDCKISIFYQESMETLGISVAGGYGNPRGDIPIYVTNIQADGCIGRSKQVKVCSNVSCRLPNLSTTGYNWMSIR